MRVGYLVDGLTSATDEERGSWAFLRKQARITARRLTFQSLQLDPSSLQSIDLLWWHFDSSVDLPSNALNASVLLTLSNYVRHGGGMLLSLLSAQYTVPLQLESTAPNIRIKGPWTNESWAEGYPDIRGFGARGKHPIFEGFLGGLYTWSPVAGTQHAACDYEDALPRQGSVVGVERLYITLNERRRNIVEYTAGRGRVLAIGSHFYFSEAEHRFRTHLERFTLNCFTYLARNNRHRGISKNRTRTEGARKYWTFERRTVEASKRTSKPIGPVSSGLLPTPDGLTIRRDLASEDQAEQFFDLGGRRILMMGKERSGLLEAWCHPLRILRDLKVQIKVGGVDAIRLDTVNPRVAIKPDSLTREYALRNVSIREITFADENLPCGAIHFRITAQDSAEILVTARIDLRLMWPLSEDAAGSLTYAWDDGLQAAVVSTRAGQLVSIIGCSLKPNAHLLGQFKEISGDQDRLVGIPTDAHEVAVGFRLTLDPGLSELTIAFAGSARGEREAVSAYRTMVTNPQRRLNRQAKHFDTLGKRSVQIITPDPEFNQSYRWALAATDRMFVTTAGLGSSFMAGYGLSNSGWNGGHETSGRPGYAWYFGRDSLWTSLGVLAYGGFEKVRSVLEFLGRYQDADGKIPHEVTTSGYAHYDAADSTPLYLIVMGRYLKACGDRAFVRSQFSRVQKALDFCRRTDTDGDHLIENTNVGHGWVEGGKLFPVHTEHYLAACWGQALEEAAFVARSLGKSEIARRWGREATSVKKVTQKDFWNIRTGRFNFGKMADGTYRTEKTALTTPGIYFGMASEAQANQCLTAFAANDFSTDWGVRIIGKGDPLYNPTGYHYGSVWPLFTGWASLAEFVSGRALQGFQHLYSNVGLFRPFAAGYTQEVLNGECLQQAGVCPHQAWSETMVLQPMLEGMLGLKIDSLKRRLILRPYFPPQWRTAEIRHIPVAGELLELRMERTKGQTLFRFRSSGPHPILVQLQPYLPLASTVCEVSVRSGRARKQKRFIRAYSDIPTVQFRHTGLTEVSFVHSGGIAVLPPTPILKSGQGSSGLRIVQESWDDGSYVLQVEGKAGGQYSLTLWDPDRVIHSAQGADIVRRSGEMLEVALLIDRDEGTGAYGRREVRLLSL
jgi:glycogen debranching enzyme